MNPKQFGIPHDSWRKHQFESVQWALNSDKRYNITEQPTGSGKTAVAAALAGANDENSVLALTMTKVLQDQYIPYGFSILKGKSNYPCDPIPFLNGETCPHSMINKCRGACEYPIARNAFKTANRRSMNYVLFLLSQWIKRDLNFDWIAMDEAHKLPEILQSYYTFELYKNQAKKLDLPNFPVFKKNKILDPNSAMSWLVDCQDILTVELEELLEDLEMNPDSANIYKINRVGRIMNGITTAIHGIKEDRFNWYFYSDRNKIRLAPLLAGRYLKHILQPFSSKILLMSATIGNIETFGKIVGVEDYNYRLVPNVWGPETRPVYDLNVPKMGYTATNKAYDLQADVISRQIKNLNPAWSGVVHVNSKKKANNMATRLARRGLQDRVYLVAGEGTDGKMNAFQNRLKRIPNTIAVSYSFNEGVDLGELSINISADVPFPFLDEEGRRRMEMDKKAYTWTAANHLVQRLGRTRRGRKADYDVDGMNGFNAIADKNWNIVKSQMSSSFLASVVKVD